MSSFGGPASKIPATTRADSGHFRRLFAGLLVIGLFAVSGCEDEETATSGVSKHAFANETVTVAVPKGLGLTESWKGLLDEWSEQTGATYRLVEYSGGSTEKKDLPQADLIVLPFDELGDFVVADRLGITLVGFLRDPSMVVYAGAARIHAIPTDQLVTSSPAR